MEMTNNSKRHRVAFASVELTIDFKSMEDAMKYKAANQGKGWLFMEAYPIDSCEGFAVSMTIRKPYKNYNPGW
jgi:hypothetical protein